MKMKRLSCIYTACFLFVLSGIVTPNPLCKEKIQEGSVMSDLKDRNAASEKELSATANKRFMDNRDGTITDRKTNLMWMKSGRPILGALIWKEAVAFCKGLRYAGYNDWHLPTKGELTSLIESGRQAPSLPAHSPFNDIVTHLDYWTQTDHSFGPGYAWATNLYYGKRLSLNKKKYAFPWPVRYATPDGIARWKEKESAKWQSIKSKHTVVFYQTQQDLKTFDRRIQFSPMTSELKWLFNTQDRKILEGNIKTKIDALFERVQEVLDMRKRMKRVAIRIYQDEVQLQNALKNRFEAGRKNIAFYISEDHTIYLNMKYLNDIILAHEMAYPIISNYMPVRPSNTSIEILARYVDKNLR